MKVRDIKKLEKAVGLYAKIEDILDGAYDSIEADDAEYVVRSGGVISTVNLVGDLKKEAADSRRFLNGIIDEIKERA